MELSGQARVCLVTSAHLSMNPRLVKEADALSSVGYDVRVVSCQWIDWATQEDKRLLETRAWRGVQIKFSPHYSLPFYWYTRLRHWLGRKCLQFGSMPKTIALWALGRVVPELIQVCHQQDAALYIGHNIAALPVAVLAAENKCARAAFDAEDMHSGMWLQTQGPSHIDRLFESTEGLYLPRCAYISAASPLIALAYQSKYNFQSVKSILNVFPKSQRPSAFRKHDPRGPMTMYWFSQTIGRDRGLEEIIRAMARVGSANLQLHLRGEWQLGFENSLRALMAEVGLAPSQVVSHALAAPDNMVRLCAEYDVGLALEHPVSENRDICLTNKICAYLLAGNAIIATATSAQREFMAQAPGCGICYEIGDTDTLAAQLGHWLANRDQLESARRISWDYGDQTFNWDNEQAKVLEAVGKVLIGNSDVGVAAACAF